MPNSPSARKRHRQSLDRRIRNRAAKSAVKTQVRKVDQLAVAGNLEQGQLEVRLAAKKLDRAAAHRVIHPNTAARLKSRLNKRLKAARQPAAS